MPVSLDDIGAAYRRAQRSIMRSLEDAADFDDDAQFTALERDQNIVDAAFFVLIFGQLEKRITDLAVRKVREREKNALRAHKFEKRLGIALRDQPELRREIENWYSVRSYPAHGEGIASGYDIGTLLARARQIETLLIALP